MEREQGKLMVFLFLLVGGLAEVFSAVNFQFSLVRDSVCTSMACCSDNVPEKFIYACT